MFGRDTDPAVLSFVTLDIIVVAHMSSGIQNNVLQLICYLITYLIVMCNY